MRQRSHRLAVEHKVWLAAGGRFALGDGGVGLLRAIDGTGSVRGGAGEVGWSYRHALAYLVNAERALGYRLVERARGGNERGGARLTPRGEDFVRRYTTFRGQVDAQLRQLYRRAFAPR
jgi:molybdate transport system regulatory protein